jgi:putative ABC transport system permease protein
MKFSDTLSLSTRMFKTRKMRTFLTILGVGVGIGTVLFLVSLGYGLEKVISEKIGSDDALLSLDVSPGSSAITLSSESLNKIGKIKGVSETSPMMSLSAQISFNELTGDGLVYLAEPSFFRLGSIVAEKGKLFDSKTAHEVVISSAVTKLFSINPDEAIGKEISFSLFLNKTGSAEIDSLKRDDKYKIVGVIADDATSYAFVPIDTMKDLGLTNFNQLKIKVAAKTDIEAVRTSVIDQGFIVSSLSDTLEQADKVFKILQIILALFGLVALVVSAIGMFNTMTITLLERINEIGIMRSIGASQGDIMLMFMIEALLMGFLGGVGGITIGYLGGELANLSLNILAKNFGGQAMNVFYRPMWFIAFIMIFSSVIGLMTGFYPARKAAKINPLDALRYK